MLLCLLKFLGVSLTAHQGLLGRSQYMGGHGWFAIIGLLVIGAHAAATIFHVAYIRFPYTSNC